MNEEKEKDPWSISGKRMSKRGILIAAAILRETLISMGYPESEVARMSSEELIEAADDPNTSLARFTEKNLPTQTKEQ